MKTFTTAEMSRVSTPSLTSLQHVRSFGAVVKYVNFILPLINMCVLTFLAFTRKSQSGVVSEILIAVYLFNDLVNCCRAK